MAKKKIMQLLGRESGEAAVEEARSQNSEIRGQEEPTPSDGHPSTGGDQRIEYIKLTNVYKRNKMFMAGLPNGNQAFLPVVIRVRNNRTFMEGDQIKMSDLQSNNLFFDFIGRIPAKKGWYGRK